MVNFKAHGDVNMLLKFLEDSGVVLRQDIVMLPLSITAKNLCLELTKITKDGIWYGSITKRIA